MPHSKSVAVIGAGISGLSCAQALHQAGIEAHLFERAGRVGGRCATRLWQGHLVDYGVQYFTAADIEFKRELMTGLRQLRPILPPILDDKKNPVPSPGGPRFYVLQGNNYFAQFLARGLDVHLEAGVETVSFHKNDIECLGKRYPAVVSSLPAPQTARLFGLPHGTAEYTSCLGALLEYGMKTEESDECYGRLLTETNSPLMASYCENYKLSRIIGHKTVFVVQGSPTFSQSQAGVPSEEYVAELARANEELWEIPTEKRTAGFGYRWPFSHPEETTRRAVDLPPGAFICGDSRSGSTVEEVWLDGRRTAKDVLAYLAS
jgi:renalase